MENFQLHYAYSSYVRIRDWPGENKLKLNPNMMGVSVELEGPHSTLGKSNILHLDGVVAHPRGSRCTVVWVLLNPALLLETVARSVF